MSQDQVETIAIKGVVCDQNPTGKVLINKEDYDPAVHELFEPEADVPQVPVASTPVVPQVEEPVKTEPVVSAPWAKPAE